MLLKKQTNTTKSEDGFEMAVLTKPTVYEIKLKDENREQILKKINTPRLTKSFIEECISTSQKLRKNNDQ